MCRYHDLINRLVDYDRVMVTCICTPLTDKVRCCIDVLTVCLSYFSLTLMEDQDQGNLYKEEFIVSYGYRAVVLSPPHTGTL